MTAVQTEAPHRRGAGERSPLLAVTALAAAVTLPGLGAKSLQMDEGFSASTSLRPWRSLGTLVWETETNGSLYSFGLKAWSALGSSEATLRSLSALAIIATVAVTHRVAEHLFDRRTALVSAVLTALHGGLVIWGQQARTYALAVLLASLAGWFLVLDRSRPSPARRLGWIACSAGLVLAHTLAVTVVVAQVLALALAGPDRGTRAAVARARRWLPGAVGVGTLALALTAIVTTHEEGQSLLSLRPGVFRDVLYVLTGRGGVPGVLAWGLLVTVGGAALLPRLRREADPWPAALVLSWAVVPGLLLLGVSVVQPSLIGRYLLPSAPALAIVAAVGAVTAWDRWRPDRPVLALAGAALLLAGVARGPLTWHLATPGEDWRGATALVLTQARAGDAVAFANDSVRLFFEYYRGRVAEDPGLVAGFPAEPFGTFGTGDHTYESFDEAGVRGLARFDRVWVVIGRNHDNTAGVDEALATFSPSHQLTTETVLEGDVEIRLYEEVP